MINRPNYIEAIKPFIDQPLVKILAGIRRCGKSTIFEMLEEELRKHESGGTAAARSSGADAVLRQRQATRQAVRPR